MALKTEKTETLDQKQMLNNTDRNIENTKAKIITQDKKNEYKGP